MDEGRGLMHFWAHGDAVTHGTAWVLLCMSVMSWAIIIGKFFTLYRLRRQAPVAVRAFWAAPDRRAALGIIDAADRSAVFAALARQAMEAAKAFEDHRAGGIGAGVDLGEFVARSLQQAVVEAQAKVEQGLAVLASVAATAPFVGLFGTVWGIFNALIALSGVAHASIDKVAGPVGEALIMTAAGLFVAIPAVLAYNACARANRLVLAQLDGFAHALHAYLVGGVRVPAWHGGGQGQGWHAAEAGGQRAGLPGLVRDGAPGA
ncbi:MotA/TolQ/ExbB proton channel family protein [Pseudothauera lacus]|uniref:Biopolymer transport protein ExbB n=1 Tax=Pseudothauera lacus TaxID=2136175 RepID=A0A2T4IK94_9RHOO|nr:MotA/TolQ/ExbB proton channel family protein [Pseudothauera lacus]PTD98156.1 biopolymer transporter ExbB [Pseudothauera lacus]